MGGGVFRGGWRQVKRRSSRGVRRWGGEAVLKCLTLRSDGRHGKKSREELYHGQARISSAPSAKRGKALLSRDVTKRRGFSL